MNTIELSSRATRDAKRMNRQDRTRVLTAIADTLGRDPTPDNADVKALSGRAPWRRLRIGSWRVIYRPCTEDGHGRARCQGQSVVSGITNTPSSRL